VTDADNSIQQSASGLETSVYHELAKIVVAAQPLGALLTQIAELARGTVPGVDDASVTLIERGSPRSVAFAGDTQLAALLDERQYEDGFGPCLDASASGSLIVVDMAQDTTYPEFARLALRKGIQRSMSVGMPTVQQTTGALNLYGKDGSKAFTEHDQDVATTFAGCAAVAMANAALYAGAVQEVDQMKQALASRASIEQAKGILMQARRCTADQAFTILRSLSSTSNRKLRDVAQSIIDEATRD
jgi:GAF domain-containing protein